MLRSPLGRRAGIVGWSLALLAGMVSAGIWRLGQGPVGADYLTAPLAQALGSISDGYSAQVKHVEILWSKEDHALGLQLHDILIKDNHGLRVLRANKAYLGLALDGLLVLQLAPARLDVDDFEVHLAVSSQGKIALGNEAFGPPGVIGPLDQILFDLFDRGRPGHALGYLRTVSLSHGQIKFLETLEKEPSRRGALTSSTALKWVGDVRSLSLSKVEKRFDVEADLTLDDGRSVGRVWAHAQGNEGLVDAFVQAKLSNLSPARIFPSVGPMRALSTVDALIQGDGALSYGRKTGLRSADVTFEADKGRVHLGPGSQAFDYAKVSLDYDPKRNGIKLNRLKFKAAGWELDLKGAAQYHPANKDAKTPEYITYQVQSDHSRAALALDVAMQDLKHVVAEGRLIPEQQRLEFNKVNLEVAGAPAESSGVVYRDEKGRLASFLTANIYGTVDRDAIFAFWPEAAGTSTRHWLMERIHGGRYSNARFILAAPPGAFEHDALQNQHLKLVWDFSSVAMRFHDELPAIEKGQGQAILQGDSFGLKLNSGQMGQAQLSDGVIDIPTLRHGNVTPATFKVRGRADVGSLLSIVDSPKPHLLSGTGLDLSRLSGRADAILAFHLPLRTLGPGDLKVEYSAKIDDAFIKQAAMGWDLSEGQLSLTGNEAGMSVSGPARLGPYKGSVRYINNFKHAQTELFTSGTVPGSLVGGSYRQLIPIEGHFNLTPGGGAGTLSSSIYEGNVGWTNQDGRPASFSMAGQALSGGIRDAGLPLGTAMPARFDFALGAARSGSLWSGRLDALALNGDIGLIEGPHSRIVYRTEMTPQSAQLLGLGVIPLFDETRTVTINASASDAHGDAQISIDDVKATAIWNEDGNRSLRLVLTPEQVQKIGVAGLSPKAPLEILASWQDQEGQIGGQIPVARTHFQLGRGRDDDWEVSGDVDDGLVKRIGLDLPIGFKGSTHMRLSVAGQGQSQAGRVEFDLTKAAITLPRNLWQKPLSSPARLGADFIHSRGGNLTFTQIYADGQGVKAAGKASVTDQGLALDVTELHLQPVDQAKGPGFDGSIHYASKKEAQELSLRASRVDLIGLGPQQKSKSAKEGEKTLKDGGKPDTRPLRLDLKIDQLRVVEDAELRSVRVLGTLQGPLMTEITAEALANGAPLQLTIVPDPSGSRIDLNVSDIGKTAWALFGEKYIRGGVAYGTGRLTPSGGEMVITGAKLKAVKAPVLAQIVSLASRGLVDTLNGEGILFKDAYADLSWSEDQLYVRDSRVTGKALGQTLKGVIDLDTQQVDMNGVIIPSYELNSLLGHIPLFGPLLVTRKGEGLVALGYSVKGDVKSPTVSVNPLSLATPGFIGRLFEGSPEEKAAVKRFKKRQEEAQKALKAQVQGSGPSQPRSSAKPRSS